MGAAVERVRAALLETGCAPRGPAQRTRARCPVHGSKGPTLALSQGRSGAVVKCHAQCETVDVLGALGLSLRDLYDEPLEASPRAPRATPRPVGPAEQVGRVIVRSVELFMLHEAQQAALPILLPRLTPDERVALAEEDCRDGAEAHYWRALARWAAAACDERYVREAYIQRRKWLAAGKRDGKPTHEQQMVLLARAGDLARAQCLERAG
jgi:hypothetical protein